MRHDFGKVVIERPRHNSSARSLKARAFGKITQDSEGYDYDGLTKIPSTSKAYLLIDRDRKSQSDLLGPLQGYLYANCGRLWDDVYSEIAYNLGRFTQSEGLRHIKDAHIDVRTNVYRAIDGHVYEIGRAYRSSGPIQVDEHLYSGPTFYVEPETGILRASVKAKPVHKVRAVTEIPINAYSKYEKVDGIWYYIEFAEVETRTFAGMFAGIPQWRYGTKTEQKCKKQLNKKELKNIRKLIAGAQTK